jgi:RNA polymerase sigma factor (TIGR02999 family)
VGGGQTLQTTALAHEAYLRLVKDKAQEWENRRHFFGAAVVAMRRILIDEAERRKAQKRGGGVEHVTLATNVPDLDQPLDVLDLQKALEELEQERPDHAEVVRYRFFLGLTVPETAELLGVAPRTVDNRWKFAKAWLKRKIESEEIWSESDGS